MKSKFDILIEKRAYLPYILVFLIVFIPQGICALKVIPYNTYDEIGPLKFLGYITGESYLGELETSYYGWGTYIWMFPSYIITSNPIYRYRVLCTFSALLNSFSSLLTFIICHKFLINDRHISYSMYISVVVGYVCVRGIIIDNEHGLLFINCLVLLFICKAFYSKNYNSKYIFTAFLAAFYGLTIHTRAVILVISLVGVVCVYQVLFKIKLLSKKQIIVLLGIGICVRKLVKIIEQAIWVNFSSTGSVANTSIGFTVDKLKCVFSFKFWKTMWIYCFGQIYALNIIMGGVVILVIFSFVAYVFNNKFSFAQLKTQRDIFIILVFGICTVALIIGVGINWGTKIYRDGINIYGTDAYSLKGIHYARYSLNYIVPLCILALTIYLDDYIYKRKFELTCVVGQVVCFLYWQNSIYPKVKNSIDSMSSFSGIIHRRPYTGIPYERLFCAIMILLNIIMLINFLHKKVLYFLFINVFVVHSFIGKFHCDIYPYELIRSEYQRASYEYLTERLTDEDYDNIDRIYSYNVDSLREQFYMIKVKIINGLPKNSERDAIVMYHGDYFKDEEFLEEISIDDYRVYCMDDKCYLLVKGRYLELFDEN